MSESTFPFDAPEDAQSVAVEEDSSSAGRKPLLLVGGLLGALVLGGGGFFLLSGDDELTDELGAPAAKPPAAEVALESVPEAVVVPVAATQPVGRNPFKALYVVPKAAAGGGAAPGGTEGAQLTTPKEIIEQSKPVAAAPAPKPAPATEPGPEPAPAPAPEPEPTKPVDDGLRYPVTLESISAEVDGVTGLIQWGFDGNFLHVQPGVNWGRFTHLRVMQVVETEERTGVMLQWGDGAPYFVALGETVYVL
jgi:hypothetical protein